LAYTANILWSGLYENRRFRAQILMEGFRTTPFTQDVLALPKIH